MVHRPLLFLIYVNDLPDGIQSIYKIVADGTSLLSKCEDFTKSERELNKISLLSKNGEKMDFNPDPKKQAIEVCFPHKIVSNHSKPILFHPSQVKISDSHKHLGFSWF